MEAEGVIRYGSRGFRSVSGNRKNQLATYIIVNENIFKIPPVDESRESVEELEAFITKKFEAKVINKLKDELIEEVMTKIKLNDKNQNQDIIYPFI